MKLLRVTVSVREMPRGSKFPFTADLMNRLGNRLARSQGQTWAKAGQNALKLADRRRYEVDKRSDLEAKIIAALEGAGSRPELAPTAHHLDALRRFRDANGRYWKYALIKAWEANYYPVASHEDAQFLQAVRDQFGPTWLHGVKLMPASSENHWWGLQPNTVKPAMWGARAIYKGSTIELVHNRISRQGDVTALLKWLDDVALPWLRKELDERHLPGNSKEKLQYREGGYVLHASPKGSYGYFYLGAWRSR